MRAAKMLYVNRGNHCVCESAAWYIILCRYIACVRASDDNARGICAVARPSATRRGTATTAAAAAAAATTERGRERWRIWGRAQVQRERGGDTDREKSTIDSYFAFVAAPNYKYCCSETDDYARSTTTAYIYISRDRKIEKEKYPAKP